ncbi:MAG: DUF5723 family protein [Bacteroidota bacterium]
MIHYWKLTIFMMLSCSLFSYGQQQYTGISTDNFLGNTSAFLNPASIVNTTSKFSVSSALVRVQSNNFQGANASLVSRIFGNEQERYRDHSGPGYVMNNFSIDVIGGYYEIDHQNSIGYSLRIRQFGNIDGLPSQWTQAVDEGFENNPVGQPVNFSNYNLTQFIYNEHRFSYARVIQNETPHFFKAGAAFKLINGIDAAYLYAEEGAFEFNGQNAVSGDFSEVPFEYGTAEKDNSFTSRKRGFGFDLGAVYEYRPEPEKYRYDMDGETDIERYDQKKYLYKVGVSINDIGRVRFAKAPESFNFVNTGIPMNLDKMSSLEIGGGSLFKSFDNEAVEGSATDDNEGNFNMNLPTTLNLSGDYNIWKKFYASWVTTIPLKRKKDPHKSHFKGLHTLTPRYETPKISVMLPISFQRNAQVNLGAAVRYRFKSGWGIFAGGNNISGFIGKRSRYTQNFFAGLSYSRPYTVPKDRDGDKISDPKDDCMYDPGPLSLNGCPDTDKDGIPDKEDYCIYEQGPEEHNGCPDRDGDGIIDLNDMCPDTPGLAIHYGCPDTDRDGVIDAADHCPEVPGVEVNNGCPMEKHACCTDIDGDGIPDDMDACPEVAGSLYNDGCPIDSSNIDSLELQRIKEQKDPNHTRTKVESIEETQPEPDNTESQQIDTVVQSNKIDRTFIYFNVDEATIGDADNERIEKLANEYGKNYRFEVIGHTDDDASENYNLILSRKRSEVVKRKLMHYGVDYDNIDVRYMGEWKPLRKNTNPKNKRFNRRVEIIVRAQK